MIGNTIKMTPAKGLVFLHKGNYNFSHLYNSSKGWIGDRNYDFTEKEYSVKKKAVTDETKANLIAERQIDDYAQFRIDTFILSKDYNRNLSSCKGEVKVIIGAKINLDYHEKWNKSKFLSIMLPIYNTFIIRKQINRYKVKLWNELMEYTSLIKKELNIYD